MINKIKLEQLGLYFLDEYFFDNTHHSLIYYKNDLGIIIDDNLCLNQELVIFDYSKYCEMQNHYMQHFFIANIFMIKK